MKFVLFIEASVIFDLPNCISCNIKSSTFIIEKFDSTTITTTFININGSTLSFHSEPFLFFESDGRYIGFNFKRLTHQYRSPVLVFQWSSTFSYHTFFATYGNFTSNVNQNKKLKLLTVYHCRNAFITE
jgi:hypothetical protein